MKQVLFLKITHDYDSLVEGIQSICQLFNYEITIYDFETFEALSDFLSDTTGPAFDIIYVAAHSNEDFVSDTSAGNNMTTWISFADSLCGCRRLKTNTKIYLGCCFGGSRRIATVLMSNCDSIGSVAGAPCVLSTAQAPLAFHSFLFLSGQSLDDATLSSAIGSAIRSNFKVHTRHEMDTEIGLHRFLQYSEFGPIIFPDSMVRPEATDLLQSEDGD